MPISRRELLSYFAVAPTLPHFLVQSGNALSAQAPAVAASSDRIVVVVRMLGGNDGLNTVIPYRDDRYFKVRPTIGIPKRDAILMEGGELGLNPWLVDVRRLIDDGHAAIVQGVGYANSSRSHTRSTEILETGSTSDNAPATGWLGRYLDHQCECRADALAGLQFGDELGRTLASASDHTASIGNPKLLLDMKTEVTGHRGPQLGRLQYLRQVENKLAVASRQLHQASRGKGTSFGYPDSAFGQSLRWTGDMIETGSATRVYYVTIGSFSTPSSPSFDTHSEELDRHKVLFSELGKGLRAFGAHMRKAGQLDRVLLLTFSDFGRQIAENRDGGTDHGDASVLFVMGGKVKPGLLGTPADLGNAYDGGLRPSVDFRQIYSNVLGDWLEVKPEAILGEHHDPFRVLA